MTKAKRVAFSPELMAEQVVALLEWYTRPMGEYDLTLVRDVMGELRPAIAQWEDNVLGIEK